MNRLTLIALTLPLAFSTAAFAAESSGGSEYQHQADAGKWEVTPGLYLGNQKNSQNTVNSPGNVSSTTDSIMGYQATGEYGINEMLSVGLKLAYQQDTLKTSPAGTTNTKVMGMRDWDLFLNGRNNMGPGSLHWGSHLTFAMANKQVNTTTQSEYSGGMALTPFVGYEMMAGPGTAGVKLKFDLYKADGKFKNNTTTPSETDKLKGGADFSAMAFYEMNFAPVIWGIDLGIVNHGSTKTADATGATTPNHDGFTAFNIETYANWEAAPDIAILPKIGFGTFDVDAAPAGTKSASGFYGEVDARFTF